jgi:phospholipase/lecithinase/hemolysin
MRSIAANSAAYGLTNVTTACFNGTSVCADPSKYLYFDDFHPTAKVHALVAGQFVEAAVPERATLWLFLAGGVFMVARRLTPWRSLRPPPQ